MADLIYLAKRVGDEFAKVQAYGFASGKSVHADRLQNHPSGGKRIWYHCRYPYCRRYQSRARTLAQAKP